MNRNDVTEMVIAAKLKKNLGWAEIAAALGKSKEWSTAALLGQMALSAEQAATVAQLLDLPEEAGLILQTVPYKGSLPTAVPVTSRPRLKQSDESERRYSGVVSFGK